MPAVIVAAAAAVTVAVEVAVAVPVGAGISPAGGALVGVDAGATRVAVTVALAATGMADDGLALAMPFNWPFNCFCSSPCAVVHALNSKMNTSSRLPTFSHHLAVIFVIIETSALSVLHLTWHHLKKIQHMIEM